MKVGDLVRPRSQPLSATPLVEEDWVGIIIGSWQGDPIVYWNEKYPSEIEYEDQLEVLS